MRVREPLVRDDVLEIFGCMMKLNQELVLLSLLAKKHFGFIVERRYSKLSIAT